MSVYFENISIDITQDTIKLSYASYEKVPNPKPPKSGFTLTRPEGMSVEEFRTEASNQLLEYLPKIFDNTFRKALEQNIANN